MKGLKIKLLIGLTILPALAYASGDRIIVSFYELIAELIILFIVIAFLKLNIWRKLLLVVVFFITDAVILILIANEPYMDNATKIDLDLCLIPALTVTLTYIIIQVFFSKK